MSINWVELTASNSPLPISQERFLGGSGQLFNADLKISMPPESSSDASTKMIELQASGVAYLSDMRFVFVAKNPRMTPGPSSFSNFSVAYSNILGTKYEQPWFGGNYIDITVRAVQDGGLTSRSVIKCQLRVDGGGLYSFSAALDQCMNAARAKQQEFNTLPVYTPPQPANASTPNELPPAYTI